MPDPIRISDSAYSTIEHAWIPLSDGCRLAAKVWLPPDTDRQQVPAILEYIPYRKNDLTAARDAMMHGYFAAKGYASARVDIRGSGDSDGFLEDEYLPQEQADALEVIRWLGEQSWCDGHVGMIGISWGAFSALQVAALAPPELGAVISYSSTDDRYALDVHYNGGCLQSWDQMSWASTVLALSALPPDPAVRGEAWRSIWLERLAHAEPVIETWLSHQRRDSYWKHGSVGEDYDAIKCPVYMVGGWADAYRDAILRFLAGFSGPSKGLIGPWAHTYPHVGQPGPAIGFLQEAVRWWDHCLKGVQTGIMDEPRLQVWMQDAVPPDAGYRDRPGRWIAESGWPAPSVSVRSYALGDGTLGEEAGEAKSLRHEGAQAPASDLGNWCPGGWSLGQADFPPDQRAEDQQALTFTSTPLDERLEIFGFPKLRIRIAADRPVALIAVRMCDVDADGASNLITRGLLNLTHRDGHEIPTLLEPGRPYDVEVGLSSIAYAIPAGHRLRVAISSTYWPWVWPSSERVTLTALTGPHTVLELPVRRSNEDQLPPVRFAQPESAPPLRTEPVGSAEQGGREIRRQLPGRTVEIIDRLASRAENLVDSGITYDAQGLTSFRIAEAQPLSAQIDCTRSFAFSRGDWDTRVTVTSSASATRAEFHVTNLLEAYENGCRIFARAWSAAIPRDHI